MIDTKKIEELARKIHEAIPKGVQELGDNVEKKIRQVLQLQLAKLNFVSREEFDIQTQVLQRTREKVTMLEKRMDIMEARIQTMSEADKKID